jgi:DMSO/TMAO reductase YedYZ molybdopterin-dependent catalytic subunit
MRIIVPAMSGTKPSPGPGAMTRRLLLAGAAATACRRRQELPAGTVCAGEVPGVWRGLRPFAPIEGERELEVQTGSGLDARYYVDLTTVSPEAMIVPAERFYLRTGASAGLPDPAQWEIEVGGLVEQPHVLTLDELLAQTRPMGVLHFECSGNGDLGQFGLMSAGDFAGVPLSWVLSRVAALPEGALVEVVGYDEHPTSTFSEAGACWIFHPEDLADAWLVTHQDGVPLLPDHGAPVRLLVPGWYGCCNLKWVQSIRWVSADAPATTQMLEFAARTHQEGEPALARDYAPATLELAATVSRVEEWELEGERILRVVGLVWGGTGEPYELHLWMDGLDLGPVELCPRPDAGTWGLWQAVLPKDAEGTVTLRCTAVGVPARRLDDRWYDRRVELG